MSILKKITLVIIGCILYVSCEPLDLKRVIDTRTDDIEILGTSVTAHGTVLDVGDKLVLDHGHCWSFSQNPTIDDFNTSLGIKAEAGDFISDLFICIDSVL